MRESSLETRLFRVLLTSEEAAPWSNSFYNDSVVTAWISEEGYLYNLDCGVDRLVDLFRTFVESLVQREVLRG